MTPEEILTRGEFEHRISTVLTEMRQANEHQDAEWNKGFRVLRNDHAAGIRDVKVYVSEQVGQLKELFNEKISPVKSVAYGALWLTMGLLSSVAVGVTVAFVVMKFGLR